MGRNNARVFTACCGKRTANTVEAERWGIIASPEPHDNPGWWADRYKYLEEVHEQIIERP